MGIKRGIVSDGGRKKYLPSGDALDNVMETEVVAVNTNVGATHTVLLVNTAGGAKNITLPASHSLDDFYHIKNIGTAGNDVTVIVNGNNVDGSSSNLTLEDLDSIQIVSDGTDWWII